ncbi:nucleotide exchange factor GrpE [Gammaproteobacteria bacterium]|nr:nucleotide exchange factor GrpE [Gammaproteobacteria bacterium]
MMAKKNKTLDVDNSAKDLPEEEIMQDVELSDDEPHTLDNSEDEELMELGSEEDSLQEKITTLEETLLRSRAELDNALKRNISDIEKAHKYGVERLLNELLPVVDNLEHALNNFSAEASEEDKEGVALTLKSFESALDKFGISPIYPLNEQFDPVKHEAVMTSKDPLRENNEIENIFQRGWQLHERVVRPARVSVIKN